MCHRIPQSISEASCFQQHFASAQCAPHSQQRTRHGIHKNVELERIYEQQTPQRNILSINNAEISIEQPQQVKLEPSFQKIIECTEIHPSSAGPRTVNRQQSASHRTDNSEECKTITRTEEFEQVIDEMPHSCKTRSSLATPRNTEKQEIVNAEGIETNVVCAEEKDVKERVETDGQRRRISKDTNTTTTTAAAEKSSDTVTMLECIVFTKTPSKTGMSAPNNAC